MLQMYWETHLGSQLFASCQASASLFSLLNLSWCYRATILGIWACVNLSISARVVSETVTSCSICSSYDNEKDFILITNSSSFYVICILGERMRSRCTAKADTVCAPCQDNYFSTEYNHNFCKSCTVCDTSKSAVLWSGYEFGREPVFVCFLIFLSSPKADVIQPVSWEGDVPELCGLSFQ